MMFLNIFEISAVEKIGWVLLHSTWQILLIGLAYAVAKQIFKTPNARYGIGIGCLMVAILAPIATFFVLQSTPASQLGTTVADNTSFHQQSSPTPEPIANLPTQTTPSKSSNGFVPTGTVPVPQTISPPTDENHQSIPQPEVGSINLQSLSNLLRPAIPWLVLGWLCGVLLFSFRPIFGWHFANKARSQGIQPVSQKIFDSAKRIANQLGIRHPIAVYESTLAKVPMVVGYLKPVILLPISAVTHLSAGEIDSILRHEIAHIRRHDTLINFLQTVIETVMFYHPCVWWISRQVRIERENCCDDLAAENRQEAISLARALLRLEEVRTREHAVVAANGGDLKSRIQRLLHTPHHSNTRRRRNGIAAAAVTASLAMIITAVIGIATVENQPDILDDETKYTEVVVKSFGEQRTWSQFKIDRAEDIARLLELFPEAGSDREGNDPAGYEIDAQLIFANDEDDRLVIGISTRRKLWSEGNGDWPLNDAERFETMINDLAAQHEKVATSEKELDDQINSLGSYNEYQSFHSHAYMKLADAVLQLDTEQRQKLLKKWCATHNDQVILLCRMLFQAKPEGKFRRPFIGAPVFIDGTEKQWPLEPIAIVNQVPILVVRGYMLGGLPEPASTYLDYCIKKCDWTTNDYSKFDEESTNSVLDWLKEKGFENSAAIVDWKLQLGLPFDDLKVYQEEKVRLQREHQGKWMAIAQEQVYGPFDTFEAADKQVPGKSRMIFRPGVDDADVEFPLSPFIARSSRDFIQFGRQFGVENKLTIAANWWQIGEKKIGLLEGRAGFSLSSPDNQKKISRHAVCSSLFADQLVITENEVRELGLARYRVPGVATYDKNHPGYKVIVKVEIADLDIDDLLLAYVIPDGFFEETGLTAEPPKTEPATFPNPIEQPNFKPILETWKMVGKVSDTSGNPLPNVEVRMATGIATLLGGGSTKTDQNGNYELEFGEGFASQGASTQVAWCFVSHANYVYHSNSRNVDLSMAMSREALTKEQLQGSAFRQIEPKDLIVRGRLHQMDIVMSRPAEILATVVDEAGNRIEGNGLQLDDSNQTSEVCQIETTETEKNESDLQYGVRTERKWRFSVPGVDRRHRTQSSPIVLPNAERYRIVLQKSGEAANASLQIRSVFSADGKDVTNQVVKIDPLTQPPVSEELQILGRDYLSRLAKKNHRWLGAEEDIGFAVGRVQAHINRNGENMWIDTVTTTSLLPKHRSALHVVTADPNQAIIRSIKLQSDFVEIAYALRDPMRQSYGNGLAGKYNGFVQTNAYSGILVLDAKTLTPIRHQCGEFEATFLDYKKLADESYVPGEIQIRGNMNCDWKFQLLEGEVYIAKQLTTSSGNQDFETTVERVELDGKEILPLKN